MDNYPCGKCILKVMCINKSTTDIICCSIISDLIIDEVFKMNHGKGAFEYYFPPLDKQFELFIDDTNSDLYVMNSHTEYWNWVARK